MLSEKDLSQYSDVHWKTQDSTDSSLLFYRLNEGAEAERQFAERIAQAKYRTLILNRNVSVLPRNSKVIPETEWPLLQQKVCDILYPLPGLKLIAITGTNGKTTTTDLVLQVGELLGKKGMSVGTLGVRENHHTLHEFGLTSPPFLDLRKYLYKYGQKKDFCVMEASSHALDQKRLHGLKFDGAGWLSFSQDHLDYHKSMEEYFKAKTLLFGQLTSGARMYVPASQEKLLQDLKKVSAVATAAPGIPGELPLFFKTSFNRDNLEVAVAIVNDVFKVDARIDFNKLIPPAGRFYIRPYKSNYIVVDFAHTPDALDNICRGLREAFPQHKLKVLFGCGGDRDRRKRPLMGAAVALYADMIYLTSDNPRNEDPAQIIQDVVPGIGSKKFTRIISRPEAVQKAFSELGENEILLLAGKGHEDYILSKGIKQHYSDIEEVEKFLGR
jgi:UDP-N-acetylmuramoyl-L-alanyl-D-glutamate--2,6-diaminopimelate ligase